MDTAGEDSRPTLVTRACEVIRASVCLLGFYLWRVKGSLAVGFLALLFAYSAGSRSSDRLHMNIFWEGFALLFLATMFAYLDGMGHEEASRAYWTKQHKKLRDWMARRLREIRRHGG